VLMSYKIRGFITLLAFLWVSLSVQAAIVVDEMPVLFVDDALIANSQDVTLILHPAEKLSSPVIQPYEPWEGKRVYCAGTALYDDVNEVFRLWYKSSGTCYAWSLDGINWIKPNLGLYQYGGNTNNNIVFPQNCITLYYDEYEEDMQKRFKMMGADGGHAFWAAYSPDGKQWTEYPGNPVLSDGSEIIDIIRDTGNNQFFGYVRPESPHPEVNGLEGKRYIGLITTENFQDWSSITNILVPDANDDDWVTEPFTISL